MRPRSDLVGIAVVAVGAAYLVDAPGPAGLRVPAAIVLLVMLPGYTLGRVIFSHGVMDRTTRVVISIALGLAALIVGGILLNVAGWHLRSRTWTLFALCLTLSACVATWVRHDHRSPSRRERPLPRMRDGVFVTAAIGLLAVAMTLGTKPLQPPVDAAGYTELSMFRRGDSLEVDVASHEFSAERYRLELRAATRHVKTWKVSLRVGGHWKTTIRQATSDVTVEALLYRSDAPKLPYRRTVLAPRRT